MTKENLVWIKLNNPKTSYEELDRALHNARNNGCRSKPIKSYQRLHGSICHQHGWSYEEYMEEQSRRSLHDILEFAKNDSGSLLK